MTQLGCPSCGTGLSGTFESCEFCGLDQAERDLLRVFLSSRGNMKELERHLGVSYPTARGRFEDLLRKLGLASPTAGPVASAPGPASAPATGAPAGPDPRLEMLRAVAAGEVGPDAAAQALTPPPRP